MSALQTLMDLAGISDMGVISKARLAAARTMRRFYLNSKAAQKPLGLFLHINSACFMKCRFCYIKSPIEMDVDAVLSLVKQSRKLGVHELAIGGGEPLMSEYLPRIVEEGSRNGGKVVIVTNGILLDSSYIRWIQKLCRRGRHVEVAFNYNHPAIYGDITGRPELYSTLHHNIEAVSKKDIPGWFFHTLTRPGLKWLEPTAELAEKLGLRLMLSRYKPVRDNRINDELDISLSEWRYAVLRMTLMDIRFSLNNCLSTAGRKTSSDKTDQSLGERRSAFCRGFLNGMTILPDGAVLPCVFTPHRYNIGNAVELSLKEIWNRYCERRVKWMNTYSLCDKCGYFDDCGGGCMVYCQLKKDMRKHPDSYLNSKEKQSPENVSPCRISY